MTSASSLLQEAEMALRFFRGGNDVEEEFRELQGDTASASSTEEASTLECFSYPRPIVVGWGIVCLQQITGQPTLLYFASTIFRNAGLGASSAALSSVGVAAVKVAATGFAVTRVDDYGRRTLLYVGIVMMI